MYNTVTDSYKLALGLMCFMAVITADHSAFAAGEALGLGMCEAIKFMTGPVGKAIATAGIIVIAVGALLGRVSWGMAVMIAAGIAGIFGAPKIAESIAEKSGTMGSGTFC